MFGYENLRDCLVFFVNDLCYGMFEGLEGNCFFVSWDIDFILSLIEVLCDYLLIIIVKFWGVFVKFVLNLLVKMKKS